MRSLKQSNIPGSRSWRGPGPGWAGGLCLLVVGGWFVVHEGGYSRRTPLAAEAAGGGGHKQWRDASSSRSDFTATRTRRADAFDLKGWLATLRAEADPDVRQRLLTAWMDSLSTGEIRGMLDHLQRLREDACGYETGIALLRRWATEDVRAAAAWTEQLPPGSFRNQSLAEVAIEWANTSLLDAAAWAGHLPSAEERNGAVLAVANEAVRSNPLEALRLSSQLPANPQQEELMRHAAMEWAGQDGPAAAEWARRLPDGTERDRLMAVIAMAWSSQDPVSAAEMAALEIQAGPAQSDAVIGIVQRWGQSQPGLAAAWVDRFPAGDLKQIAWDNLEMSGAPEPLK